MPTGKRNLVFMVADGMGPSSLSMARSFRQYAQGLPEGETLTLDDYIVGQSRTRSTDSLITDSAAGATAFACGHKSYNGAVAMLPNGRACASVMEAAKAAGYMTGLVVTTGVTDATPACFASHVRRRSQEDDIAVQLLGEETPLGGRSVDVLLGAGRCRFLPNTTEGGSSCRSDERDLVSLAKDQGYTYVDSRASFDRLRAGGAAAAAAAAIRLPLLGLFADHHLPFEIDRRHTPDEYPSLPEMAAFALRTLSDATRGRPQGFFLMIEGSRVDHAGHANDPVAHVHELLAYDDAVGTVLDFLHRDKTQGLLVATSDHETGGLATARQLDPRKYPEYAWEPSVLANASRSVEWVAHAYGTFRRGAPSREAMESYLRESLAQHLGIADPSEKELVALMTEPARAAYTFADMLSRRAAIGWTTHGHSAADVNVYASDADAARALRGSVENTAVGGFLWDYLGVRGWMGEVERGLEGLG